MPFLICFYRKVYCISFESHLKFGGVLKTDMNIHIVCIGILCSQDVRLIIVSRSFIFCPKLYRERSIRNGNISIYFYVIIRPIKGYTMSCLSVLLFKINAYSFYSISTFVLYMSISDTIRHRKAYVNPFIGVNGIVFTSSFSYNFIIIKSTTQSSFIYIDQIIV